MSVGALVGVLTGAVPLREFMSPRNMVRLIGTRGFTGHQGRGNPACQLPEPVQADRTRAGWPHLARRGYETESRQDAIASKPKTFLARGAADQRTVCAELLPDLQARIEALERLPDRQRGSSLSLHDRAGPATTLTTVTASRPLRHNPVRTKLGRLKTQQNLKV